MSLVEMAMAMPPHSLLLPPLITPTKIELSATKKNKDINGRRP
jgi:hypothetical protein